MAKDADPGDAMAFAGMPLEYGALATALEKADLRKRRDLVNGEWETPALRTDVLVRPPGIPTQSLFVGSAHGVFTTAVAPSGTKAYSRPVSHVVPRRLSCGCPGLGTVSGVQLVDAEGNELALQVRPEWV